LYPKYGDGEVIDEVNVRKGYRLSILGGIADHYGEMIL